MHSPLFSLIYISLLCMITHKALHYVSCCFDDSGLAGSGLPLTYNAATLSRTHCIYTIGREFKSSVCISIRSLWRCIQTPSLPCCLVPSLLAWGRHNLPCPVEEMGRSYQRLAYIIDDADGKAGVLPFGPFLLSLLSRDQLQPPLSEIASWLGPAPCLCALKSRPSHRAL